MAMVCTHSKKVSLLAVSGAFTAAIGLIMYCSFPILLDEEIKKRLVLKDGSETYKYWKKYPVPIYVHFYFFNVTNREEIWDLTNKPVLEELGPYTFRETREKVNVTWNENGTVSYKLIRKWYYEADKTNGSLEDIVTTLNVPMVAAAMRGKKKNQGLLFFALEEMFSQFNSSWFVQKKVRELLFEGYDDKLMKMAQIFSNQPFDKFGWFYKRNGTDEGLVTSFTGATDIQKLDLMDRWNGVKNVHAFEPPCNMINGSAGDLWPPSRSHRDQLMVFFSFLCRSLSLKFLETREVKGIRAARYYADEKQLDNGQLVPENKCFCREGTCFPAGALDVSACQFNAPLIFSYPHFLFADPVYGQGVIGMKPDPQKHKVYVDVVPEMGIQVAVAAKIQINIVFEAIPDLTHFENITNRIYFPILWFSLTTEAGDDVISLLKLLFNTVPYVVNVISFFMISAGGFLILSAFVVSVFFSPGKKESSYFAVWTSR